MAALQHDGKRATFGLQRRLARRACGHKAQLTGADLSQATIDELALHLEDLYAAALAEGADGETALIAQMHSASEGYFESMGATLARGRTFTSFDGRTLRML